MENLLSRIEIINSFKLLTKSRNKKTKLRIRNNYIVGVLMLTLSLLCVVLVFYAAIADLIGVESGPSWGKSTIIVISSISLGYELSMHIYKAILLKHLQNLEKSASEKIDSFLNEDLATIIFQLETPKRNILIIVFGAIILIGAVLHQFGSNQFWGYFKIPILLFFGLMVYETIRNLKKLNLNIGQTESRI